jgi:hypothetical protein
MAASFYVNNNLIWYLPTYLYLAYGAPDAPYRVAAQLVESQN